MSIHLETALLKPVLDDRDTGDLAPDQRLDQAIDRARDALLSYQHPEGYWCFELEADCTIPAEYILMMHFMGEIDEALESKMAVYLRSHQCEDGGWNLFSGGESDLSCSVKAYYALKLVGDSPQAPHMMRARETILAMGGAAQANVFTHYTLALFGQIPWDGVPFLPVEIMLLPRWSPFHFNKVSYWSRTVMIPLSILYSLRAGAKNPKGVHVRELFITPPENEKNYFPVRSRLNRFFLGLDRTGRRLEPFIPGWVRRRSLKKAEAWLLERLNGTDGLGAIFPAMVNALEALACLGYPPDHPCRINAKKALENLLVLRGESAYCQPCVSPVWDTALSILALMETSGSTDNEHALRALDWLKERQVLDGKGDWRKDRPEIKAGGWAFQFNNPHYPDLDDTAVVALAMDRSRGEAYKESVRRAVDWICGMQSKSGGFAAFDVDNMYTYLNEIPFADHGALLDPPTADVTARCTSLLACLDISGQKSILECSVDYLRRQQEPDGSWFGRWGTNYIYGTWSVLTALVEAGDRPDEKHLRRAVAWLKRIQRPDGGWSEGCCSYCGPKSATRDWESTSFQTAWALLALMAGGETESQEVRRGIEYLILSQRPDGLWKDDSFTAPGFPRVFYLKYHGYDKYFPLWALARYRTLRRKGKT
jgi:squalene-hopene/tetraprenyl-beta-curcumene cyclase